VDSVVAADVFVVVEEFAEDFLAEDFVAEGGAEDFVAENIVEDFVGFETIR